VSTALEARAVSVTYGDIRVCDAIDLTLAPGEWVAVIGPNGAGKSSFLRALAGLAECEGEVWLDGVSTRGMARRRLAQRVALVPQQPHIPYGLTVAEYVLLGRTPHIGYFAAEGRADRLAAERAIVRLGLRTFVSRTLGSLSGGEVQRVVLARALAQEAPVLLLDEPTSALDLGGQQLALELVDRLRREAGLAVISAMHDLSLAGQYAERLLLLDAGRVIAQGTAAEVLSEELISAHYGAEVHIVRDGGQVYVLPRRRESTWAH
jgi:iron complex transport system ATP-binding protein